MTDATDGEGKTSGTGCAAARWCSGALPTPRVRGACCRACSSSPAPSTGPRSCCSSPRSRSLIGLPIVLVARLVSRRPRRPARHPHRARDPDAAVPARRRTLLALPARDGVNTADRRHCNSRTDRDDRRRCAAPRSPCCRSRTAVDERGRRLLRRRHPRRHPDAAHQDRAR